MGKENKDYLSGEPFDWSEHDENLHRARDRYEQGSIDAHLFEQVLEEQELATQAVAFSETEQKPHPGERIVFRETLPEDNSIEKLTKPLLETLYDPSLMQYPRLEPLRDLALHQYQRRVYERKGPFSSVCTSTFATRFRKQGEIEYRMLNYKNVYIGDVRKITVPINDDVRGKNFDRKVDYMIDSGETPAGFVLHYQTPNFKHNDYPLQEDKIIEDFIELVNDEIFTDTTLFDYTHHRAIGLYLGDKKKKKILLRYMQQGQ